MTRKQYAQVAEGKTKVSYVAPVPLIEACESAAGPERGAMTRWVLRALWEALPADKRANIERP